MKKIVAIFFFFVAPGLWLFFNKQILPAEPAWVRDAQERVSSYTGYHYSRTQCTSTAQGDERWIMICTVIARKDIPPMKYIVYPARFAPYNIVQNFYLIAANRSATEHINTDLMRGLHINIRDEIKKE